MAQDQRKHDPSVTDTPSGFVVHEPISGFMALMGDLYACHEADGSITLGVRVDKIHLNHQNAVHGGFVSTLADNAMGTHVARAMGASVATVHLDVDFLGRVKLGQWLEVRSRVDRQGKRLVYAACEGWVGADLVFRSTAVFSRVSVGAGAVSS